MRNRQGSIRRRWAAQRRGGLTLLELVVVMGVLAALAAIVVPLLPNLLRRAHKASDATQSSELAKIVQMYQAAYFSYPDNFDLLLTSDGAFPKYLPTSKDGVFGGFTTPTALTDVDAKALEALNNAGIKYVRPLAADTTTYAGFHPTRYPYDDVLTAKSTTTELLGSTKVAMLATDKIPADSHLLEADRAADPTAKYVVFGVGPGCSMVGQVIQDAPMSVPQNKDLSPDKAYCHFGLIFKVSGKEVSKTERARLVATVALEDDELEATDKDIVGYYNVSRNPSDDSK